MRRALLLGLVPVVATVASCLGPTEIMVHVTTNACATLKGVDLYVGAASAPATSTSGCIDPSTGEVGTIAVLPSGAVDARIDLGVVGDVGGACSSLATTDPQCIVSKRSLSFEPHTRLDLPIFLDIACAGFQCPSGETCVADQSGPHCENQSCDVDGGIKCAVDAGGGPDVAVVDVRSSDVASDVVAETGPPLCVALLLNSKRIFTWSFNPPNNQVNEDLGAVPPQALAPTNVISTASPEYSSCGQYLVAGSVQNLIAPSDSRLALGTFGLAFAYRTTSTTDATVIQLGATYAGFRIFVSAGLLTVVFNTNTANLVYRDTAPSNDGKWHTFVMHVSTTNTVDSGTSATTASFTRDSALIGATGIKYVPTAGPLTVGAIDAIDQVELGTP